MLCPANFPFVDLEISRLQRTAAMWAATAASAPPVGGRLWAETGGQRGIVSRGGKCEFAAGARGSCQTHQSGHSGLRYNASHAGAGSKVSNVQEAGFAKLRTPVAHRDVTGPFLPDGLLRSVGQRAPLSGRSSTVNSCPQASHRRVNRCALYDDQLEIRLQCDHSS